MLKFHLLHFNNVSMCFRFHCNRSCIFPPLIIVVLLSFYSFPKSIYPANILLIEVCYIVVQFSWTPLNPFIVQSINPPHVSHKLTLLVSHPPRFAHVTMQEFPNSQSELWKRRCFHSDDSVTAADGVAAAKEWRKGKKVEQRTNRLMCWSNL